MRVKICGITRREDAELAVGHGAWAIGLIFHEPSPRRADLQVAAGIGAELKRRVEVVGVFVNRELSEVAEIADACSLTIVQLHGDEGPAYCDEVHRRTGAKVIKAVRVASAEDVQAVEAFRNVDFHLLDAHHPELRGGTGHTFEWDLARRRHSKVPLILSGGLTHENVGAAIAAVRPYAVDVASGTEAAPGVKDAHKLEAFAAAVRAASEVHAV